MPLFLNQKRCFPEEMRGWPHSSAGRKDVYTWDWPCGPHGHQLLSWSLFPRRSEHLRRYGQPGGLSFQSLHGGRIADHIRDLARSGETDGSSFTSRKRLGLLKKRLTLMEPMIESPIRIGKIDSMPLDR